LPQRRRGRRVVAGHLGEQRELVLELKRRAGGGAGERHAGGRARHDVQRASMQHGEPYG